MTVKRRIERLEKAGYGAKPPFACIIQEYVDRVRTNSKGKTEEFVDVGPIQFSIPDGPLGSGKELHIKPTELMEAFRDRIRAAYLEAWGCEHHWLEMSPETADL